MAKVPGIETADYEIVEVEHTVEALTKLLDGKVAVCNTVGPFDYFGDAVVQAAANAGCNYLDTTGEQAFMMEMREKYADRYRENGTILAPSVAYMYTPLDIAAHLVLEDSSVDTLEAGCLASGVPTYGSTQTIFAMFQAEHYYLENNQLMPWQKGRGFEMVAPGKMMSQLAHPWGGGSLPLWFQHDHRVQNARQLTAFTNRAMFEQVIEMQQHYENNLKDLPQEEQAKALQDIAAGIQPGTPPRENKLVHRSTDFVHGIGTGTRRTCVLHTAAPYQLTGIVQAALAYYLLDTAPLQTGFVSGCQAAGHNYMLGSIQKFLPIQVDLD